MRLNRSDAGQNGRAASICKAYAKRTSSLQAAFNQDFIGHRENVRLPQLSQEWDFSTRFWDTFDDNCSRGGQCYRRSLCCKFQGMTTYEQVRKTCEILNV